MTVLYFLLAIVAFVLFALVVRRLWPIVIGTLVWAMLLFLSIYFFGFMPDYSDGFRSGLVQKYSVKGLIFKSNEAIMILPIEGMVMSASDINVFSVSCIPRRTPDACAELARSVNTRSKVTVKYTQYLVKPVTQDSDYTVRDVIPHP